MGYIRAIEDCLDVPRRASMFTHPGSAAAEACRVLLNNLDFINFRHGIKALLITSAAPAEGKRTVVANLAAGLAQAGKRVVLVACDFRKPTTHQFFGVRNQIGLSDVLTGQRTLSAALKRPIDDLDLPVLTGGKIPPNPSELLRSEKMSGVVDEFEQWADWTIIDTLLVLVVADGVAVARFADAVLLVAKCARSGGEAVKNVSEVIQSRGGRLVDSGVWGLDSTSGRRCFGYGYCSYADYCKAPEVEQVRPKRRRAAASDTAYIAKKGALRVAAGVVVKAPRRGGSARCSGAASVVPRPGEWLEESLRNLRNMVGLLAGVGQNAVRNE